MPLQDQPVAAALKIGWPDGPRVCPGVCLMVRKLREGGGSRLSGMVQTKAPDPA